MLRSLTVVGAAAAPMSKNVVSPTRAKRLRCVLEIDYERNNCGALEASVARMIPMGMVPLRGIPFVMAPVEQHHVQPLSFCDGMGNSVTEIKIEKPS